MILIFQVQVFEMCSGVEFGSQVLDKTLFDLILAYTRELNWLLTNYSTLYVYKISTQHTMSIEINTYKIEIDSVF